MHHLQIIEAGNQTVTAEKAVIFIHGRGGSAEDILSLSRHIPLGDAYLVAPQAVNHTWYPYSFMAPKNQNEPWLSSAIQVLEELVDQLILKGYKTEQIYFVGFSQGACLTLEYVATHAKRYGGVMAFIGGLIGDVLDLISYTGDLEQTPIYIGTSDPDPHVPIQRVQETDNQLQQMGANVKVEYFKKLGHTISMEGLESAIQHVLV